MTTCLEIQLSTAGFSQMASAAWILNAVCVLISVTIFGFGIYILAFVENVVKTIEDYNTKALQYTLIIAGILAVAANVTGAKLCKDCTRTKARKRARHFLFGYVMFHFIVTLGILASGIICFVDLMQVNNSVQKGLATAMGHYKTDLAMKEEVDLLQMNFDCCGNNDYKDWFEVPWIHLYFLPLYGYEAKRELKTNQKQKIDIVPFSCCNPESPRPCIHEHVHSNSHHLNYDYRLNTTLFTAGCKDTLTDFLSKTLTYSGIGIMVSFLFQLMLVIIARLLQSSLDNAYANKTYMTGVPYKGWILGCQSSKKKRKRNKKANEALYESINPDESLPLEDGEEAPFDPSAGMYGGGWQTGVGGNYRNYGP